MNPQSNRTFIARGEAYRNSISVPVIITGAYSDLEVDPVRCRVVPDMHESSGGFTGLFDELGTLQLRGRTEHGDDLYIPTFRVTGTTHARDQTSWEGIADFLVKGDLGEFDGSEGSIVCTAFIPPTPLATPRGTYMPSYDGTITLEGDERKGIRWNTMLGEAELVEGYEFRHERVGISEALIRLQRCQVLITIEWPGIVSLRTISNSLQDALDEPLWLLSFLGRKRIGWYEAEVVFVPSQDARDKAFRKAFVRRGQWLGYKTERQEHPSWIDLLARQQALADGLFQHVYDNYRACPFKETIRRLIPYLLIAREVGYFEAQLGIVYSALEGLLNGLDRGYLLGSASFNRLSKKLRKLIGEEIEEQDVAQTIIKKLPELRRRPYADRLMQLLDEYKPNVGILWPPGTDISSEIQALVRRRDTYIHQGNIDEYDAYIFDLERILNLTELLILRLLDFPDTAINYDAVSSRYPINRP